MLAAEPGYVDTGGSEDHDEGIPLECFPTVVSFVGPAAASPETGERVEQRLRGCEKTVASEGRSRSAGAQEPECMLKYMRIPSTAGTRDPERSRFFRSGETTD
jgi:hypothetical protein